MLHCSAGMAAWQQRRLGNGAASAVASRGKQTTRLVNDDALRHQARCRSLWGELSGERAFLTGTDLALLLHATMGGG